MTNKNKTGELVGDGTRRAPFWAGGVKFKCRDGCAKCCKAPGEVYFSPDDVRRAAQLTGVSEAVFRALHLRRHNDTLWKVVVGVEEACPFLDGTRCSIHEAKPTQCATFPFWPEHVKSEAAYTRLREACPGVEEELEVVPAAKIRAQVEAHKKAGLP